MTKKTITKISRIGDRGLMIYIPSKLRNDSRFPFTVGEVVVLRITRGRKMVIEKIEEVSL